MKKNRTMRVAAVLLIAAILTTFAISGTFAKYTTSKTGSDTARVARWGFDTASISFEDLFSKTYKNVASSDNSDVIAPGTSGKASFRFQLADSSKKPEVAYNFTVSTDGSNCDTSIQNNTSIKWALTTSDAAPEAENSEWGTWTALLNEIKGLSGDTSGSKQYEAGNAPAMVGNTYYVHWMWAFGDDNSVSTDTAMGNAATLAGVTLTITISATQID